VAHTTMSKVGHSRTPEEFSKRRSARSERHPSSRTLRVSFSPHVARRHGRAIMDAVRRLKLERAAHRLVTTDVPVTHVALESGFASSQALCSRLPTGHGVHAE
jgi:transcriptional regulator GlxA family with amidase domain